MKLCTQAGCTRPHLARGLCQRHYARQYRATHTPRSYACMTRGCFNLTQGQRFCTTCRNRQARASW